MITACMDDLSAHVNVYRSCNADRSDQLKNTGTFSY